MEGDGAPRLCKNCDSGKLVFIYFNLVAKIPEEFDAGQLPALFGVLDEVNAMVWIFKKYLDFLGFYYTPNNHNNHNIDANAITFKKGAKP